METESKTSPTNKVNGVLAKRFPWPEWLLLLAGEALFIECFPVAGSRITGTAGDIWQACWRVVDIRNWNLVGYIAALGVVLVVFVALKVWNNRAEAQAELQRWLGNRRRS